MTDFSPLCARIGFAAYRNITAGSAAQFARMGVTPELFFQADAETLARTCNVRSSAFDSGRRAEILAKAREEEVYINKYGIRPIYHTEPDYPERLRNCEDAPAMLYALGNPHSTARCVLAVVGTRHATAYGLDMTRALVSELAERVPGLMIVSGLAYGIDVTAHRAALSAEIPTVAVMAQGLNTVYPADHRDVARRIIHAGGGLVSENPTFATISRGSFLARNRIVAGLADAVLVVESDLRGGSMSTARLALAYNRDVGAVPGRATDTYSRGCNHLIASP